MKAAYMKHIIDAPTKPAIISSRKTTTVIPAIVASAASKKIAPTGQPVRKDTAAHQLGSFCSCASMKINCEPPRSPALKVEKSDRTERTRAKDGPTFP